MQRRIGTLRTLALAALVMLAATGCDVMFQGLNAQASAEWKRTYKLEPGGQVEVILPSGAIDVAPSADTTTVEVIAERRAHATSEQAAKDELKKIQINEQATPTAIKIEVPRSSDGVHFGRASREVRFNLKVPATATVKVDTRNGEVHVTGLTGPVKVDSTNGNIVGENLGGAVRAATTNGNIRMQVTGIPADGLTLDTTNGEIELQVPAASQATISARWVHGDFDASGLKIEGARESRRYEGKLNGGGPRVELSTTNGRIRIWS